MGPEVKLKRGAPLSELPPNPQQQYTTSARQRIGRNFLIILSAFLWGRDLTPRRRARKDMVCVPLLAGFVGREEVVGIDIDEKRGGVVSACLIGITIEQIEVHLQRYIPMFSVWHFLALVFKQLQGLYKVWSCLLWSDNNVNHLFRG